MTNTPEKSNIFGPLGSLDERGAEDVRRALEAAHGNAAAADEMRRLLADKSGSPIVRGYARWALEQLSPRRARERRTTFHVAAKHPRADDANPGTRSKPWRTIQRAAETLRAGDTVLIHAGTYRECVRPFLGGTGPDRMITYCAAPDEKPVIKGSDIWRPDWRKEGKGVWSAPYARHAWDCPEQWPSPQPGPKHRAEQVFFNGRLLTHVGSREELEDGDGVFFTDDAAGRLWIRAPGEGDVRKALVERAMRQQVFAPAVRGLGFIHVQGLTMLHAAAPEVTGMNWGVIGHRAMLSVRSGHHWTIEDNTIEWGNAQGMDVGGEGPYVNPDGRATGNSLSLEPIVSDEMGRHLVRRNRVNYHGVAGIVGWAWRVKRVLLEDNETNYNCQKGNFGHWEAAGVKLHGAEDCIIRRHRSHGNQAFGIWLDYDCARNRITQCILTDNLGGGFFHEASPGPALFDNNVVLRTRLDKATNFGAGIYSHDGSRGIYVNNFIRDSGAHGVWIRVLFGRNEHGQPTTASHNLVANNYVLESGFSPICLNPELPRGQNNRSAANVFWQGARKIVMTFEGGDKDLKWEETAVGRALGKTGPGNLEVPFAVWQSAARQDVASVALKALPPLAAKSPARILKALLARWPAAAPALDRGCGDYPVQPVGRLIAGAGAVIED